MDLAYHDVNRDRGLYYLHENGGGQVERVVTDEATCSAPCGSRRRPRGRGCAASSSGRPSAKRRDYTVDWVHLKLNDQAQRTVLCKDPFKSVDERVEQLIAHM